MMGDIIPYPAPMVVIILPCTDSSTTKGKTCVFAHTHTGIQLFLLSVAVVRETSGFFNIFLPDSAKTLYMMRFIP